MDVQSQSEEALANRGSRGPTEGGLRPIAPAGGATDWAGVLLGEWQQVELRIARAFAECRGLSTEQLEDLYQETVLALLPRRYESEEHLRNALRAGLKH